jgi:Right handed beta helix region
MIRILAKLFAVAAVLTICSPIQPSFAETVAFVSATGSGSACSQTAPCGSIFSAILSLGTGGRIVCVTPVSETESFGFNGGTWVFDCPSAVMQGSITITGNAVLKFQHMSFSPAGGNKMFVSAGGGGTLIYDDCVLEDATGAPLDIEPAFPFDLAMKNSRISNNGAAGVIIKPAAGGSVMATFDGVTITKNAGGLHTDSTNGAVRVDISNSTISNNADNGLAIVGGVGTGGTNIVNLSHDVIASNGQAGIEVSGTFAAAYVDTTLLDTNAGGAMSTLSSGKVFTFVNNRIIGSFGSGFSGSASPN